MKEDGTEDTYTKYLEQKLIVEPDLMDLIKKYK